RYGRKAKRETDDSQLARQLRIPVAAKRSHEDYVRFLGEVSRDNGLATATPPACRRQGIAIPSSGNVSATLRRSRRRNGRGGGFRVASENSNSRDNKLEVVMAKNSIPKHLRYTVEQFHQEFPDNDSCLQYIAGERWPDGRTKCPSDKCEGAIRKHHRVTGRTAYACDHCGNHIYPLAGTIFEKTSTSLRLW